MADAKAPERIWAWGEPCPVYCSMVDPRNRRSATPYIRADLYEALAKERDELRQDMGIIDDSFIAARQDLCKALARAAAAAMDMRERAAEVAKNNDDEPDWLMNRVEGIRALPIDPDAQKALDKLLAEAEQRGYANAMEAERKDADQRISKAREDAIREAAHTAWHSAMAHEGIGRWTVEDLADQVRHKILALLNDGGRDE